MLPDFNDGTYPQAAETANTLDDYAGVIAGALEEVPPRSGGTPYLPTESTLRACRCAVEQLRRASDELDQCGGFEVRMGYRGAYHRPVDRVRWALEALDEAAAVIASHQVAGATPAAGRMRLMLLAEAVRIANEDLGGMLWKPIMMIAFPHDYRGD